MKDMKRKPLKQACVLISILLVGCAATIEREHAPSIYAPIVGSDEQALYVVSDNQTFKIDGRAIRDIDHPGNVLMVIGGTLLGMAALVLAVPARPGTELGRNISAGFYGSAGLGLLVGGALPYFISRSQAAALGDSDTPIESVSSLSRSR